MQVELLRDSIIGIGKIDRPNTPNLGDAVQSGMVVKPKTAKAGDLVNLSEPDANRMIALGSARIPQETKKAA